MSLKEFSADSGAAIADEQPVAIDQFAVLELSAIVPSLTNPRVYFNEPRLAELAESIQASGVHQPVLVRPLPASRLQDTFEGRRKSAPLPQYELIAGERRFRASKLAGVKTIPAMIRPLTDDQVLEVQLIENLQRDDLHPMEEAEGYERLSKATGVSKEDIGAKVGKSRAYVYARIKLLDLTSKAREAFLEDKIDASRALVIARIPDVGLQEKALAEATRTDWNGSVPSFRSFTQWAHQNVMLKLSAASFKITDAELVPGAGSCKECPKRTGASPDLFADVDSADVCIDPTCFHSKEAAAEEALLAQAAEKGQKVISEREAKKLWGYEHGRIDGYVRLDRPDPRLSSTKMLKTILGKDMPEPILMVNPHKKGELIEVLPTDKVTKLLKDSGRISPKQARSERVISASEAKQDAMAKYERTWRKRAIAEIYPAIVAGAEGVSARVSRLVGVMLLDGLREDERSQVCELLGLGKVASREAIEAYLRECTEHQAEQAMHLLLMQHDMQQLISYRDGTATGADHIEAVAADFAVDIAALQAKVRDELKEAAQAKAKPPKSEEPAPAAAKAKTSKKSNAPPAAQKVRARKPTKEEVQGDIARALQELDQAPYGAAKEEAADAAVTTIAPETNPMERHARLEGGADADSAGGSMVAAWPFPKGAV